VISRLLAWAGFAALPVAALAGPLEAQQADRRFFIEGRGGVVVPTFDIDDVAKSGGAVGATLGYRSTTAGS
jgi:hypothetical protein